MGGIDASRWLGPRWWTSWPERGLFDVIVDGSAFTRTGSTSPHPQG
ncbi:MAG TPA: hypothetical protein VK923_18510 [Euzebyales bacterium]|nr:hypothetical protein [Euzebyales bacterium]